MTGVVDLHRKSKMFEFESLWDLQKIGINFYSKTSQGTFIKTAIKIFYNYVLLKVLF